MINCLLVPSFLTLHRVLFLAIICFGLVNALGSPVLAAADSTGSTSPDSRYLSVTSPLSDTATPISIALTISPTNPAVCQGGSVALSAIGCPAGGTVRWSTNQTGTSISVKPGQATSYVATCTVTGTQTGTATASTTVAVNDPITIIKAPTALSACEGIPVSFSVVATGTGVAYKWFRNGVPLADPSASTPQLSFASVTLAQDGDYTVAISNQCGTVTTSAVRLTVAPGLVIGNSATQVTCNGTSTGQIFMTATGGTGPRQYQINGLAPQTSNIFPNLKAGTYQVVVSDQLGCAAKTTIEITQPVPLTLTVKAVNAKCSGGADGGMFVSASGGNGGPYQFQLNGGTPQTGETFFDLKDKTTYTVSAIDKLGCVTSQSVAIGASLPFDIKATVVPARCTGSADGTISVSSTGGTGAYKYQIGTGEFQAGSLFTGLAANNYEITVQDVNGCTGKKMVTVPQPAPLQLTAVVIPVNCFGANSASITLSPSGGTGPVQYQLTTTKIPQSSTIFKNLAVGDYTVVGTDSNGCTTLLPVTVGKADPISVQAKVTPATCCVCPTGKVVLTSGGGTGTGRQFQLIGRSYQASNQFGQLPPATYLFRVSDEVGCTDSVCAVITDASAMSLSPGRIKDIACAGGRDGEAAVQLTGGTRPFTFYWQTEGRDTLKTRTQSQTGLSEGTYTVSVLDSNRCTTTTTFVTVKALAPIPPKPVITQTNTTLSIIDVTGVQWYVRADSGAAKPVPNGTQSTLIPYQSGRYFVIVTQNGCASPPSDAVTFILTALSEPVGDLSMRVVPNPVVDRLRVEIDQVERQGVQLHLLDLSGRSVREYQIPAFTGKKQAEWPLSGVSAGVYLLKAEAGSRQSVIRVVVE